MVSDSIPAVEEVNAAEASRRHVTIDEYIAYRRDGFLICRGLVSPQDIAELRQHTDDLMDGRLPEQQNLPEYDPDKAAEDPDFTGRDNRHQAVATVRHLIRPAAHLSREEKAQQFLRLHMLHRRIALHERYMLYPRLLDVLEVLIGPDVLALQTMLFLKAPGKPGQGWHQDSYYIPTLPDTLIGTWIAIDDADEYNGCMWFAKGSGHEPIYPPCPEIGYGFGDRLVRGITHVRNTSDPDDSINKLTPIAERYDHVLGAAKAGDVVFFNGHVLHRSKRNITADRFRRAFVGHYCNARSFTPWGRDTANPDGFDPRTGSTNGSHILARGDTHLPFARPKFGTPCAALLPKEQRARQVAEIARQIARLDHGLMGCAITDMDSLDREHDREHAGEQQNGRSHDSGSDAAGY